MIEPLKKSLAKLNKPLANFALVLIKSYQAFLSGLLGGNCRFYPSCSCYAEQAYSQHRFFYATRIVANRIFACRPLGRQGYDPVPEVK